MTLEEAILSLTFQIRPPFIEPIGEDIAAIKLGIEALKRIKDSYKMTPYEYQLLLPGRLRKNAS